LQAVENAVGPAINIINPNKRRRVDPQNIDIRKEILLFPGKATLF
jgi:hypothetical protein